MKIAEHYLIPSGRMQKTTNKELHGILADVLDVVYGDGAELQNNLLVILYLCKYISADELTYYLGLPENSFKSLHVQLNYMEKKKLINKISLRSKDGFSRTFYYLSQEGFYTAAPLFASGIPTEFKRRGKEYSVMHDYSVGLNALQLILFGKPFSFVREYSYGVSAATGRDKAGSLRVDAICIFQNTPYRLFIEEDLGNEPNGTLLDKLVKYNRYGNMEHASTEAIVYSFRKPYCTAEPPDFPVYSPSSLKALLKGLEASGINSLADVINMANSSSQSVSEADIAMVCNVARCVGILNRDGRVRGDMSLTGLADFIKELEELRSDWRVKDLNKQQYDFTLAKFRMLSGLLISKYRRNNMNADQYMSELMKGFSVWMVPTSLLVNYMPFIFPELSGMHLVMESSIRRLWSTAKYASSLLQKRLIKEEGNPMPLILKNIYVAGDELISIEYLSRDIGSLMRVLRFRTDYLTEDTNITVLCLVDSYKDALFFSNSDYLELKGIRFTNRSRIFFILRSELHELVPFMINSDGSRSNVH